MIRGLLLYNNASWVNIWRYILNYIILYAKLESCGVRCAALCLAKTFECECVTGCVRVEDVEKKKRGMSKEVSEKPIFFTPFFNSIYEAVKY